MPTATVADVRKHCNFAQVDESLVLPHLAQAERHLRRMLTATEPGDVYDQIAGLTLPTYTEDDQKALVLAEAVLAGWYLLPFLTHVATAKGLHRTGGRTGGNTDVGLLDKGELAALRSQWREQVDEIIDTYLPRPEDDEDENPDLILEAMSLSVLSPEP